AQIKKGGHQTLQNQIPPPQSRSLAKSQPLFYKSFIKQMNELFRLLSGSAFQLLLLVLAIFRPCFGKQS
ncbi:hypothetical protein P3406_24040, partial [Vibrio parahaemolyticus]|nr:hypothetical protein [Vibrio parahaemolyticus]